jgi:hypothetical protein
MVSEFKGPDAELIAEWSARPYKVLPELRTATGAASTHLVTEDRVLELELRDVPHVW